MMVSIVIPALNEEKYIGRCLASLLKLKNPTEAYEVIVVDNGSTDRTIDIVYSFKDRMNLKIFEKPGINISALRNFGVKYAKSEVIGFLDADCTVSKDWVNNAIKYFDSSSIGAVGSSHIIPVTFSWVAKIWDLNTCKKRKKGVVKHLPSGNLFVSKENFKRINGFDESLITNEDYELCFRLREIGLIIYSDPAIQAVHWGAPNSLSDFYKQQKWHGKHVLKVFFEKLNKIRSLADVKEFKACLFGIYYFLVVVGLVVGFLIFLQNLSLGLFIIALSCFLLPPALLTLGTIGCNRRPLIIFVRLYILYLLYAVARAVSTFSCFISLLSHKLSSNGK